MVVMRELLGLNAADPRGFEKDLLRRAGRVLDGTFN